MPEKVQLKLENLRFENLPLSNPPTREVNLRLEKLRKESRLSYDDLSLVLPDQVGAEQLRRHIVNDSSNLHTICLWARSLNQPCPDPEMIPNGAINKEIKRRLDKKEVWTMRIYAFRLNAYLKKTYGVEFKDMNLFIGRLYKYFDNGSTDAFLTILQWEFWGEPTMCCMDFLNRTEKVDAFKDAQLTFTVKS